MEGEDFEQDVAGYNDHDSGLGSSAAKSRAGSVDSMRVERDEEMPQTLWHEGELKSLQSLARSQEDGDEMQEMQEVRRNDRMPSLGAMGHWRDTDGATEDRKGKAEEVDSDTVMED